MRRTRRNAVVPRDDVPADRPDKRAEDHILIDDSWVYRPSANGGSNLQMENEIRNDVERGGECHGLLRFQHAGGHNGCDGIGGVVETVHEVEHECDHDERNNSPEGELNRMHRLSSEWRG